MKIARIVVDRLVLPLDPPFEAAWDPTPRRTFGATVVRVETDDGMVGIGGGDTLHGVEPHLPLFIGTDPRSMVQQVRRLDSIDLHAGRPWPIEIALWDLLGKVWAAPVWQLFGGAKDQMGLYASLGARRNADELAAAVTAVRDAGFRACKLRVDARTPEASIAQIRRAREACGSQMILMVDLNQAWRMAGDTQQSIDHVAAREFVEAFVELRVKWIEEPLDAADHAGLAALRADGRVRIAGGEMTRTVHQMLDDVLHDRYDVFQPDVALSGMSHGRTLAQIARHRMHWYAPHTWTDGLGLLANLHVCAGVGGGPWLEYPYDPDGWTPDRRDFMLQRPVDHDLGTLALDNTPGLGIALDENAIDATRVERIVATADGVTIDRTADSVTVDRPANDRRRSTGDLRLHSPGPAQHAGGGCVDRPPA